MKLSEKLWKNQNQIFCAKRDPGAPEAVQGRPPLDQAARWRGHPRGRATNAPGPTRAPQQVCLLPTSLSSSSKNCVHPGGARVLGFFAAFFDLLPQPSISAEILGNCSLVCDSSTPPNRFFNGKLICEYFGVLGSCSYDLACMIRNLFLMY